MLARWNFDNKAGGGQPDEAGRQPPPDRGAHGSDKAPSVNTTCARTPTEGEPGEGTEEQPVRGNPADEAAEMRPKPEGGFKLGGIS
jgi:hypothetical protein